MRKAIPPIVGCGLIITALAVAFMLAIQHTGNMLIYTLDDAYIHMAIARNVATNGTYGINPGDFQSVSSSPLWILLLAGTELLFGAYDILPLIIATVFACASVFMADIILRHYRASFMQRLIACSIFALLIPLAPLVSTGMEHTTHIFFLLVSVYGLVRWHESPSTSWLAIASIAISCAALTRFETLFIAVPIVVVFIQRRSYTVAAVLTMACCLPLIIFAAYSYANGAALLPNSLLLKGNFPSGGTMKEVSRALGMKAIVALRHHPHMLFIVLALIADVWYQRRNKGTWNAAGLCLISAVLFHMQYARTGWFNRYEGYLIAISICYFGVRICTSTITWKIWLLPAACFCILIYRSAVAHSKIDIASRNIYEQQVTMARFVREKLPPGAVIAVNDIGAVSYFGDGHIVDLEGLGDVHTALARRNRTLTTSMIDSILVANNVHALMVYDSWFIDPALPSRLIRIGSMTISNNVVCGGSEVTIYAPPSTAASVRSAFESFR
ncbi:MAG: hypothetical protein H7X70_02230 [Candidatus Kapabacteria bacterium]|nr:hypothetical protein [Candidatus Kapabacteria bacterium]